MVRARCSRLLVSQFAVCRQLATKLLSASGLARRETAGVIGLVDQHAGQHLGVQLDVPAAVGGGPHEDVGHDTARRCRRRSAAGLGIEPADLGHHVGEVFVVDAAEAPQAGRNRAWRAAARLADQACMAGSNRSALAAASPGTRRGRGRATPVGSKLWTTPARARPAPRGTPSRPRWPRSVASGSRPRRRDRSARGRSAGRTGSLTRRGRAARRDGRAATCAADVGFEVRRLASPAAAGRQCRSRRRPRALRLRRRTLAGRAIVSKTLSSSVPRSRVELAPVRRELGATSSPPRAARSPRRARAPSRLRDRAGSPSSARSSSGLRSSFLLDEGGQFEAGELQQLDRLQKLRRHHQGLALAHFQPLQQTHRVAPVLFGEQAAPCVITL